MRLVTKDRQYRSFSFEHREAEDGSLMVQGKPVLFNQETVIWEYDGVQYKEKVDSGALDGADMGDVVFNIDHEGKPAAKTKNRTLGLFLKTDGLYMEADLSKNATGRELYEDIKNGFYDKMSFAFTVKESSYDKETRTRTILKIDKVYDVSAVTFPAYQETSLVARSWAEAQHEIEKKAAEAEKEAEASKDAEALELERLRTQVLSNF